jgi:hypothetical protein
MLSPAASIRARPDRHYCREEYGGRAQDRGSRREIRDTDPEFAGSHQENQQLPANETGEHPVQQAECWSVIPQSGLRKRSVKRSLSPIAA